MSAYLITKKMLVLGLRTYVIKILNSADDHFPYFQFGETKVFPAISLTTEEYRSKCWEDIADDILKHLNYLRQNDTDETYERCYSYLMDNCDFSLL